MTEHDDRTVDHTVEAALQRIPVPDHTADFWQRLDVRLSPATGTSVDVRADPHRRNGHHVRFDQAPDGDTHLAAPHRNGEPSALPDLNDRRPRAGEVAWYPADEPTATEPRRPGAAPPPPTDADGWAGQPTGDRTHADARPGTAPPVPADTGGRADRRPGGAGTGTDRETGRDRYELPSDDGTDAGAGIDRETGRRRDEALGVETTGPKRGPGRRTGRRRSGRWQLAAAAVAVAAAVVAVVLVPDPDGGRVETRPSKLRHEAATTSTTGPSTSSTGATGVAPGASDVPPGSEDTVLAFLDALGAGDLAGAASRLGVASEAYIGATSGSVEDFLRQTEAGYGAWATAEDRTTSTVVLGPGDVVVVVRGRIQLEGTVEERIEAFPARYAESAGAWLVEPWALDPEAGQLALRTPVPTDGSQLPVSDGVDEVVATTPGDGTAWLAVDDLPARATTVGIEREATWSLAEPLPPGEHTLTVAFVDASTFVAMSWSYVFAS